jgi:hypothetical protein
MGATTSSLSWLGRALVACALGSDCPDPPSADLAGVAPEVRIEEATLPARVRYLNRYLPLPQGAVRPVFLLGGGAHLPDEAFFMAKDWAGRSISETNRVVVCTWASESLSNPDPEPVDITRIIRKFNPDGDSPEIDICVLPTVNELLKAAADGTADQVVLDIKEKLNASSVVCFTGGDQAVLLFIMEEFPELRDEFIRGYKADQGIELLEENEAGTMKALFGWSAGMAILSRRPIAGDLGRGPGELGVSAERFSGLLDGRKRAYSLVAREGLGLPVIPELPWVDQHHGLSQALVAELKEGKEIPIFQEDGVTPVEEIRDGRVARFLEATAESQGLAVWQDCGCVVYQVDGETYLRVFSNPDSPYRAPGLPAAGLFGRGEVTHLFPGCIYHLTEGGVDLCESGSEEE